MLPEEPLPSSVLLPTVMLLVAVWMVPGANGLIARNALGLACVSDPGPGLLTAPATWPDGSVTDLRTGGGVVVPEPATHLPEVYHEFSSGRTRAHLARLTHHPIAARAYLDYLLRLSSARTHLTLTHAELRVFEFTASGWRSRLIAASP